MNVQYKHHLSISLLVVGIVSTVPSVLAFSQMSQSSSSLSSVSSSVSSVSSSMMSSLSSVSSMSSASSMSSVSSLSSSSMSSSTNVVSTLEFEGEITKIDGSTLFVESAGQTRQFNIPSNVKVTRNTMKAELSKLQVRDSVKITSDPAGQILEVEATGAEVFDFAKYAIPIAILAILLLGLLFYLWRRSQQGHIKTTTDTKI